VRKRYSERNCVDALNVSRTENILTARKEPYQSARRAFFTGVKLLIVVSVARRRQSAFVAGEAHVARFTHAVRVERPYNNRMICQTTKRNKSFRYKIIHSIQKDSLLVG
jgi:hypothetical protein